MFRSWATAMIAVSLVTPSLGQSRDSTAILTDLEQRYEIKIETRGVAFPVKCSYGEIGGKDADRDDLDEYIGLFAKEFSFYPPALVKRTKLTTVVLCRDLSFAGQLRSAIPDFEHDTLYLDVSRAKDNKTYQRKVLHHEFFHIIDYEDDGSVYEDKDWAALNPPGFKYGDGGKNAQENRETSVLTDKYPGFLNHYSTTGVEEDKAEIFTHLFVDAAYLDGRSAQDPVLAKKVKAMKHLLAKFCPDMNDEFWRKVRKVEA